MDNTKELRVVFTGDSTDLAATMAGVQKQAESVGKSLTDTGRQMSAVGSSLTGMLTLPIVGVGAASAMMAVKFGQAMTYVRTDAGDTTDNIDQLSQSVLNMAKASQFGPEQLANGLYHLASLGLRGADAMNALNTAQQMAAVGGADLESTASALGAALVSGIKGVQDYSQAAGTLDAIIGAGNMRMQDLVNALGSGILPVAKNAGLSLTDVGAALATLTDNGMGAEESATRLRMTFALMEAPSQKASDQLAAIGMTSNQVALDMRTKGLVPALADLKQHLLDTYGTTEEGKTKMAAALTEIFGGGRSSAAAQTLIDQLDRVSNKETQIGQQSGEFSQKVAEQQATASAKIKTAWSGVQSNLIELGGRLLPGIATAFSHLTNLVNDMARWWGNLSNAQQGFIIKVGLVVAALGPMLSIFGRITSTFGQVANLTRGLVGLFGNLALRFGASEAAVGAFGAALGPVGLTLGIVGGVVAALTFHMLGQKSATEQLGDATKKLHDDIKNLKSAEDDLQRTELDKQQADLRVAEAQQAYNDAVANFGPNSLQAQQALLDLKQAQLDARDAGQRLHDKLDDLHKKEQDVANDRSLIKHLQDVASNLDDVGGKAFSAGSKIQMINGSHVSVKTSTNAAGQAAIDFVSTFGGRGYATGTKYAPGGMALVGEQGPELVQLPRGSEVIPNGQTAQMMGGGSVNLTVNVGVVAGNNVQDLAATIYRELQRMARANGFNGQLPNIGVAPTG